MVDNLTRQMSRSRERYFSKHGSPPSHLGGGGGWGGRGVGRGERPKSLGDPGRVFTKENLRPGSGISHGEPLIGNTRTSTCLGQNEAVIIGGKLFAERLLQENGFRQSGNRTSPHGKNKKGKDYGIRKCRTLELNAKNRPRRPPCCSSKKLCVRLEKVYRDRGDRRQFLGKGTSEEPNASGRILHTR